MGHLSRTHRALIVERQAIDVEAAMAADVDAETMGAIVRRAADAAHQGYDQYVGHWDGWQVASVETHRDIVTKGGLAFCHGDVTLVKIERGYITGDRRVTAYSWRLGWDVVLGSYDRVVVAVNDNGGMVRV